MHPITDSANGFSYASPTVPTDGAAPALSTTTRVHRIVGIDGMQAFRLAVRFAESELGFLARARGSTITFLGGHDLFSSETVAR